MVAVKIHAGLGNQLFQYAFAFALSKRLNTELLIDGSYCSYYPTSSEIPAQTYHLDRFGISSSRNFDNILVRLRHKWLPNRLVKKLYITGLRNEINRLGLKVIKDDLTLNPDSWYNLGDQIYLDGYFQYPNFFQEFSDDIRHQFNYNVPEISKKDLALINSARTPVAINLRRTDYLKAENLKNQGICPISYYQKAIKFFKRELPEPTFFVISDDIKDSLSFLESLKENFIPLNDNRNKDVLSDFYLMQQFRYLVLANSSYSWWAAYLNMLKEKIIIAPEKWVVNPAWSEYNAAIIPNEWIRI